ncbi:hypothetical protein BU15DRAFT_67131 [Melanogaster broomeanus]|nr:hypothetical protein BU15DRAFT_67131 [Melanogaster broomeanus]
MSSNLQSTLASLQLNDYVSVVIASAVGYDYILTFPSELLPLMPTKEETMVLGFYAVHCLTLCGVFGRNSPRCTVLSLAGNWAFLVFLAIADFLMILRVYAMYNRSRMVLNILFVTYIPTIVLLVYGTVEQNPKTNLSVTDPEVLDVSFCAVDYIDASSLVTYIFIPRFILGGFLCILALAQFVRQSLEMHRAIQRWRSNRGRNWAGYAGRERCHLSIYSCTPVRLRCAGIAFPRRRGHIDTGFGVVSRGISTSHSIAFARAGEVVADTTDTVGDGSRAEGPHQWSDDRGAGTRGEAVDDFFLDSDPGAVSGGQQVVSEPVITAMDRILIGLLLAWDQWWMGSSTEPKGQGKSGSNDGDQ